MLEFAWQKVWLAIKPTTTHQSKYNFKDNGQLQSDFTYLSINKDHEANAISLNQRPVKNIVLNKVIGISENKF